MADGESSRSVLIFSCNRSALRLIECMTDETKAGARNRVFVWLVITVVVLPLLYVLSIGPLAWVLQQAGVINLPWAEKILGPIYLPLIWLASHSPAFEAFLKSYLHLFGVI